MQQSKRERIATLVEQWRNSGLNASTFARDHQIADSTMRRWINPQKTVRKIKPSGKFIALPGVEAEAIYLEYPNGARLYLPVDTPLKVIQGLISVQDPCFQ